MYFLIFALIVCALFAMVWCFIKGVVWLITAVVLVFIWVATSHAAEPPTNLGYMANKSGGAIILTQRGTRQCRKPWREAFTTNAQNQVIRRTCWRPEGDTMINMRLAADGDTYMIWPRSWFTFDGVTK